MISQVDGLGSIPINDSPYDVVMSRSVIYKQLTIDYKL